MSRILLENQHLGGSRWRPPSAAAAPHGHPCHSHGEVAHPTYSLLLTAYLHLLCLQVPARLRGEAAACVRTLDPDNKVRLGLGSGFSARSG